MAEREEKVKFYKEKIAKMVKGIHNERFLTAIYISIKDFIEETEKEEKPD